MVYIVLINYNGYTNTIECIESIYTSSYKNFKVVIVDNCSTDSSREELNRKFMGSANIVLLYSESNKGFAAGINIALGYIKKQNDYDYVWILGNDSVVCSDTLEKQLEFAKNDEKLGILGLVSLDYYNHDIIQCFGVGIYNKWIGVGKNFLAGKYLFDYIPKELTKIRQYIKEKNIYIYGNSLFLTKCFVNKIDKIPEEYFIYYEELELMQLLKQYKFTYDVVGDAFVYHKESSTISSNSATLSELGVKYSVRNRILFTEKYYKPYLPIVIIGIILLCCKKLFLRQFKSAIITLKTLIGTLVGVLIINRFNLDGK